MKAVCGHDVMTPANKADEKNPCGECGRRAWKAIEALRSGSATLAGLTGGWRAFTCGDRPTVSRWLHDPLDAIEEVL